MGQRQSLSSGCQTARQPGCALRGLPAPVADSTHSITREPTELAKLKAFLAESDVYVFTANAFPYGAFKGKRVKEQVYEPDWRTDKRAAYSMRVADVLAALASPEIQRSIQSPPLGYKPRVTGPAHIEIETYTWDVLPEEFKTGDIVDYVVRELEWVRSQLV
jgi:hypothetical protein